MDVVSGVSDDHSLAPVAFFALTMTVYFVASLMLTRLTFVVLECLVTVASLSEKYRMSYEVAPSTAAHQTGAVPPLPAVTFTPVGTAGGDCCVVAATELLQSLDICEPFALTRTKYIVSSFNWVKVRLVLDTVLVGARRKFDAVLYCTSYSEAAPDFDHCTTSTPREEGVTSIHAGLAKRVVADA